MQIDKLVYACEFHLYTTSHTLKIKRQSCLLIARYEKQKYSDKDVPQ